MKQRTSFPPSNSDRMPDPATSSVFISDAAPLTASNKNNKRNPKFHSRFKIGDRVGVVIKKNPQVLGTVVVQANVILAFGVVDGLQRSLGEVNLREVAATSPRVKSDLEKKIDDSDLDPLMEEMAIVMSRLGLNPKCPSTAAIVGHKINTHFKKVKEESDN